MFYVVPAIIGAVALAMAVKVVKGYVSLRQAWSSGLTAQARCLRTFTTTSGTSDGPVTTTLHHVYEFTPAAGVPVRIEEQDGPATTLEGDVVTVYYSVDRPEKATSQAPGTGRSTAGLVVSLVFIGAVLAFCVFFALQAHEMFAADFP
ncbi:hypothetical protein [Streptomyces sp. CO7]